ncbi:MAG: spermidine synthase [Actinomycetota bacterium]|nr:spermidine synthase [Actinomycetota bacterium]
MSATPAIPGYRRVLTGRWRLMAASALMLFVQLALIRWSGANLVHLSYFSNLILLASFLGIGLGFLRSRTTRDMGRYVPLGLLLLVAFIMLFPAKIEGSSSELIFFTEVRPTGLPTWVSLPLVFLVVAVTMTMFGEITGRAFREFSALNAYRWDIIGSILGTLGFTLIAFLRAPSWVWPLVTLVILWALYGFALPWVSRIAMLVVIGALAFESMAAGVSWSPYYKVNTETFNVGTPVEFTKIQVNGIPHQNVLDFAERLKIEPMYGRPYERAVDNPLRNVLVVGAGTGTDVALALAMGAEHVDAVEIDPRIQQIGQQVNPNRPYDDPRVSVYIDDGRAFLSRTDDTYDLILFALPDSLTLVSGASQLRLESYLFTEESIAAARDHLTDEGVFAMYNYYREPWLINRLAGTVDQVYGHAPCLDTFTAMQSVAAVTIAKDAGNAVCAPGAVWDRTAVAAAGQDIPTPAADDHPFLYLKDRTIPSLYLIVIALIIGVSLIGVRVLGGPFSRMRGYGDLFFMGAAFLLLETRSITTFALLFGTTWVVNALVFTGVLVAVLAAIEVTQRRRTPIPRPFIITALFVSLAVAFLVPNSMLLSLPVPLRLLLAIVLAFAPIFFANLLFTSRFKDAANPTAAFAANLFGAMIGGCLEYLSLLMGYQWLIGVAALLYLAAVSIGQRQLSKQSSGVTT